MRFWASNAALAGGFGIIDSLVGEVYSPVPSAACGVTSAHILSARDA